MLINYQFKIIKQKVEHNLKQFKNYKIKKLKKTYSKILWTQNCTPRSFPRLHNYFEVCGHNSVSPH